MAIVRCPLGKHFFDDTKYSVCPHCSSDSGIVELDGDETIPFSEKKTETESTVGIIREEIRGKSYVGEVDTDFTRAMYSSEKGNNLITGWLVCIEGPERGRDYRIYHGVNKVGRGNNMNIIIRDDLSISREKALSIIYDHKNNMFFIRPEVGNMVYLNGKLIVEAEKLFSGDNIKLGNSIFEFVAFCKEGRKWN